MTNTDCQSLTPDRYFTTFTDTCVFKLPSLNITSALLALSFAFIENTASPFSSVTCLLGDTFTIFGLYTFVLTVSPSTGQLSSPVTVTITVLRIFTLNINKSGSASISVASSQIIGVGVAVDVGVGVCVGVTVGVTVGVAVGVGVFVAVGVGVCVVVGVPVGVGVVVAVTVGVVVQPMHWRLRLYCPESLLSSDVEESIIRMV